MNFLPTPLTPRSLRWLRRIALVPSISLVGCLLTVAPSESSDSGDVALHDAATNDGVSYVNGCRVPPLPPYIAIAPPDPVSFIAECTPEIRPHVGEPCTQLGYVCGNVAGGGGGIAYGCRDSSCGPMWQVVGGGGGPLAPPELS